MNCRKIWSMLMIVDSKSPGIALQNDRHPSCRVAVWCMQLYEVCRRITRVLYHCYGLHSSKSTVALFIWRICTFACVTRWIAAILWIVKVSDLIHPTQLFPRDHRSWREGTTAHNNDQHSSNGIITNHLITYILQHVGFEIHAYVSSQKGKLLST